MKTFVKSSAIAVPLLLFAAAVSRAQDPAQSQAQSPPPKPAPSQEERALLDQAFRSLEEELKAAVQDFSVAMQAAQAKGLPREQWPKSPAPDFYERFEALALKDQPDALRWCIGIIGSVGFGMDEAIARKLVLYEHMVAAHASTARITDIVSFLGTEWHPTGIGAERAAGFLDEIAKVAPPDVRPKALWTKCQVYEKSPKAEHKALLLKSQRQLAELHPTTIEGKRAKGAVFQAEHLQIGMTAPDVSTTDVDGAAFKLSDYRGKVVAIVFWGFWCPPCRAMLPHEKALVERLAGKPFAMIGVNTDDKKDEFKRLAGEQGVTWKNSWQGSKTGPWPEAWGIAKYPSVYVLDEDGVIRAIDVRGDDLAKVVDDLLAKLEAKKAGKSGGAPPK
jgi:thiol-disulfide isomerase/thioredoxin